MASTSCLRPMAATRQLSSVLRNTYSPSKTTRSFIRNHSSSSVSADELSHFSALASSWWDPVGPSRPLHLMNPLRHDFIASCLADAPPRHLQNNTALNDGTSSSTTAPGLQYLDIGCGGGIFAESLARTIPLPERAQPLSPITHATSLLAIDPSTTLIRIARDHARIDPALHAHLQSGRFRYENTTVEALSETPDAREGFDMVTLFEVLEHVDNPLAFLTSCLRLVRPGGWLVGSTIARTCTSFLVSKAIAEAPWPIGVVPPGTHEWNKFVNVDEAKSWAQEALMRSKDGAAQRAGSEALEDMRWKAAGVIYIPGIGWKFVPGSEYWGNYFWAVRKGV
ncbi:hypothetical protein DTO271G3_8243 [Paecilomyces variotii]|nr:hypothetical protein DTO271G3_8243 [Paecilomyces variotii]